LGIAAGHRPALREFRYYGQELQSKGFQTGWEMLEVWTLLRVTDPRSGNSGSLAGNSNQKAKVFLVGNEQPQ
jgi:hypothetical protein